MPELETELTGGDWLTYLKGRLLAHEYLSLKNIPVPEQALLSAIVLETACGKSRAKEHLHFLKETVDILPEIDFNGERRCCFKRGTKRCTRYSKLPVCEKHRDYAMTYANFLQSRNLQQAYTSFLKDPRRMQLDAEQAIMRLMLTEVLKKLEEGSVPLELVSGVTILCEKISQLTERAAKITAITPEMVEKMLEQVVVVMEKYVPPDQLAAAAAEIENIKPTQVVSNIEYVPGDKLVEKGTEKDIRLKKMEDLAEKLIQIQANMES